MTRATSKLAFVTGATGFIGANVARALLEKGCSVRLLARPGSDRRNLPEGDRVEVWEGDLRDPKGLLEAVKGASEVYHVAADYRFWAKDYRELYENNVTGTKNLLEAASKAGVRKFIHTSTVGTIGLLNQPSPCDEESPYDPGQFTSHYKKSKLEAEKLALEYAAKGLPVVVVNPSAPIGPWDRKPTPTGKIIVDFMQGKLPAYVDTGLNFVHVRDVALGHLLAAEKGRVGQRYILGGTNLSMIEFLKLLSKVTQKRAPRFRIPYPIAWAAGWVSTNVGSRLTGRPPAVPLEAVKMSKRYMFFNSSKAVRELGLPRTPVEAAVNDAVDWFAKNQYFSFNESTTRFREATDGSST